MEMNGVNLNKEEIDLVRLAKHSHFGTTLLPVNHACRLLHLMDSGEMAEYENSCVYYNNLNYNIDGTVKFTSDDSDKSFEMGKYIQACVANIFLILRERLGLVDSNSLSADSDKEKVGITLRSMVQDHYKAKKRLVSAINDMFGASASLHRNYQLFSHIFWDKSKLAAFETRLPPNEVVQRQVRHKIDDLFHAQANIALDAVSASAFHYMRSQYAKGNTTDDLENLLPLISALSMSPHALTAIAYHTIASGVDSINATKIWDISLGREKLSVDTTFMKIFAHSSISVCTPISAYEYEGVGAEYTYKVLVRNNKMDTSYLHTRTDGFFITTLFLRETYIYILARPNSGVTRMTINIPAQIDPQRPYRFSHESITVSKVTQKFLSNFTNILKQIYNTRIKMASANDDERQEIFEAFLSNYTISRTELAYPHLISSEVEWLKHAIIYLSD